MKPALETFNAMQQAGSDSLQILQDMCEFVHLLTTGQVIADFAQDKSLPEFDRQLLTELSDIKVPALARAWQILLKGIGEVQSAAHPAQAAEMVLIRLAYAAELPPPADLIRQLRETAGQGAAASSSAPAPSGGPAPRAKLASGGGAVLAPAVAKQAISQTDIAPLAAPTNYKELVALFAEKREGQLHAQLYANVNPVRCERGILEIRVGTNAPANLAAKLGQCLTQWTGQRWMISLTDKGGEPTLAGRDKAAEQARRDKALAHPLAQATLKAFPGAKLISLKQKAVAPVATVSDDSVLQNDEDEPLSPLGEDD
jgi:DNA polymerase-3 subunit gamma/tau